MAYRSTGEDAIASLILLVIVLAVVCAVFLGKLLLAMFQELGRIYVEQGPLPTRVKRILWGALLGFFALSFLCGLLAMLTASAVPIAVYTMCWGFLIFVLVIEAADWWGQRQLGEPSLDTYLSFSSGTSSSPGAIQAESAA